MDLNDLQMGLPVYCADEEKVGALRFVITENEPPYEIQYVLVDRTDGIEGGMLVEKDDIESVDENAVKLSIRSDAFYDLPPFVESDWFYQHSPAQIRERDPRSNPMPKNRSRRQDMQRRQQHYGSSKAQNRNY
ncbi:hypothetical protein IJT93_02620 [bacterium]|nr:hypothetical protein [bacterium]